jgi:endonuclease/exonuclease/phosphatase family metal-dependent hydrolase
MGEFSLLSLNTFGLPLYLGWERLGRMAQQLNRLSVTTICLQELQQNAYAHLFERSLTSYPHAAYERHTYAPKGGLGIYSRLPLIDPRFMVYQDRGTWHSLSIADWATYKGMLLAQFEIDGMPVCVINTHLNANYLGVWHPSNRLTRILQRQVDQVSQAIRSMPGEMLVILCGDFNFPRDSFLYGELIASNDLFDPLAADQRPTYRPFPLVPDKWKTSLDFVLVRRPAGVELQLQADLVPIEDPAARHPVRRFLTDHNALLLHASWGPDRAG